MVNNIVKIATMSELEKFQIETELFAERFPDLKPDAHTIDMLLKDTRNRVINSSIDDKDGFINVYKTMLETIAAKDHSIPNSEITLYREAIPMKEYINQLLEGSSGVNKKLVPVLAEMDSIKCKRELFLFDVMYFNFKDAPSNINFRTPCPINNTLDFYKEITDKNPTEFLIQTEILNKGYRSFVMGIKKEDEISWFRESEAKEHSYL